MRLTTFKTKKMYKSESHELETENPPISLLLSPSRCFKLFNTSVTDNYEVDGTHV